MGFLDSIANFFGKKKEPKTLVKMEIDPYTMKRDTLVRGLSYENAEIKAKNAKLEQEVAKLKQRSVDRNEEENVKVVLNQQKRELQMQSQGKVLALKSFYGRYFREKKFRDKLAFYSFDRSTKLADFGDLAIAEDGDFVLLDSNGRVLLRMEKLKDIFQSVGALGNDMATGKIPLWLDKQGGWIENIMEYEVPEIISTGEKLRFAKARKRPVYEIIQGLNGQIGSLHSDLAESELMANELQDKVDKYESMLSVQEQMSETSRAELTANEQRLVGIDRIYRQTQKDMAQLRKINEINEDQLTKLETEIEKMRGQAERQNVKLSDDKALEIIQRIRSTMVNELPDAPPVKQAQSTPQS